MTNPDLEYSIVKAHIADINRLIPNSYVQTYADDLLQAGLICQAGYDSATSFTGRPPQQNIASLTSEAMAKIKVSPRLFSKLVIVLEKIDQDFASMLRSEYARASGSTTGVAGIADSRTPPPALPDTITHHIDDQEEPTFSLDKEKPKELAKSKEDYEAAKVFALKVKIVIQSCNDAEYYAALEMLEPPPNFDWPVKYFHKELLIVVGTFAGIEAAIVKTAQGEECKEDLKTVFKIFRSAKLLLGLGICFGLRDNPAKKDLKFADVLVASGIGVSKRPKAESDGIDPREEFKKVKPLVFNIFCNDTISKWNGIAVCEVPAQRIAKVYVGRLVSASILMNDLDRLQKIKEPWRNYLGGEMEGWAQMDFSEVESIIIKGISDFAGKKNDKWQLTAAKAAVNYAHYKLEHYGYIPFDEL